MRELKGTTLDHFRLDDDLWESKATEIENVGVVESLYRAIEQNDVTAFTATLDESVRLDIVGPDRIPFTGSASGRDSVVEFAIRNFSQLEEQNAQINELIAQGNTVVVFGQETGKFKDGDSSYEIEWVQRFRIENGKVASIRQIFDTASLSDG